MKTKKKVIILCSICLVVLVVAIIADRVLGKSYFNQIKYDDLIAKIENKEDVVVLISQTTCPHCSSFKPKLKEVADEEKINIYYIDVDKLPDKGEELNSYINFSDTPVTVFLKKGEETTVASRIKGDQDKDYIRRKLKSNGFID